MQNELDRSTSKGLPWRVEEAYAAEVELERERWKAITAFVELLTEEERSAPGYYHDPDWSVKDLIAHLGAWTAEARMQLLDIAARSYVPHEPEIDARNAATLAAMRAERWHRVWAQTTGSRAWMLDAWFGLSGPDEAANQWIRKAGAEHYGEHLSRLRDWVTELVDLRTRPKVDDRDP
jgi:Mycothiol maleylpyruvate isomerase N-terminal domain.